MMALGHLERHTSHPQGLPHGLAPPIRRCGKGGYRLGSAVRGFCPTVWAVLQGTLARVSAPSFFRTLPTSPGLTGHAEAKDAAMFLEESLQQGALPSP